MGLGPPLRDIPFVAGQVFNEYVTELVDSLEHIVTPLLHRGLVLSPRPLIFLIKIGFYALKNCLLYTSPSPPHARAARKAAGG